MRHRRYVYYEVPEDRVADALAAAGALQFELAPGAAELLRRPGSAGGLVTVMEVWAPDDDAHAAGIEARAAAALSRFIAGQRHVEVFEVLQPADRPLP